jgi:hypothetical protein
VSTNDLFNLLVRMSRDNLGGVVTTQHNESLFDVCVMSAQSYWLRTAHTVFLGEGWAIALEKRS